MPPALIGPDVAAQNGFLREGHFFRANTRSQQAAEGTKEAALHLRNMRMVLRALDRRIRQYYSSLLSDVPQELVNVLRGRLSAREAPKEESKLDRVRPGAMPRVRMPQTRRRER
jgi:hypothetical protein